MKRYPSKPFLHARIVTLVLACLPGAVCAQNSPLFLPPYTPWPDFAVSVVQPGDVNNDGRVDLVGISDSTPTILNVMLQSNDGSFAPPMHVNLSNVPAVTIDDLQVVDLDGDGLRDLLFSAFDYVYAVFQSAPGIFDPGARLLLNHGRVERVRAMDRNADGRMDFLALVRSYSDDPFQTVADRVAVDVRQAAGRTFAVFDEADLPAFSNVSVVDIVDIDRDGSLDFIAVESDGSTVVDISWGTGPLDFAAPQRIAARMPNDPPQNVLVTDLDGDGALDIIAGYWSGLAVAYQQPARAFTVGAVPAENTANRGQTFVGDLDGNGRADLLNVNSGTGRYNVYLQTAFRTLVHQGNYAISAAFPSYRHSSAFLSDLNGDAALDFVVVNYDTALYYNRRGNYPYVDVAVTTTAAPRNAADRLEVLFTHTVRNRGIATARVVGLEATVDARLELLGTPAGCTDTPYVYLCVLMDLEPGESRSLMTLARAFEPGELDNLVRATTEVFAVNQLDADPGNDALETTLRTPLGRPDARRFTADRYYVLETAGQALMEITKENRFESPLEVFYRTDGRVGNIDIEGPINGRVAWWIRQRTNPRLTFRVASDGIAEGSESLPVVLHDNSQTVDTAQLVIIDDAAPSTSGALPLTAEPEIFRRIETFLAGIRPKAFAIGDVSGDGRADLVVASAFRLLTIFEQRSDGTLAGAGGLSLAADIDALALGNLDNDPELEIAVGDHRGIPNHISIVQRVSGGYVVSDSIATLRSTDIEIGDVNGDSRADLVSLRWGLVLESPGGFDNLIEVRHQTPQGTLDAPVFYTARHAGYDDLAIVDLDRDGRNDVVVVTGQSFLPHLSVLMQNDDGTLAPPIERWLWTEFLADHGSPAGVAVGDFDGSGLPEILVPSGDLFFYEHVGASIDELPISERLNRDIRFAVPIDYNNDGRLDVVTHELLGLQVYSNSTRGRFEWVGTLGGVSGAFPGEQPMAVGDLDGDGYDDLAFNSSDERVVVAYTFPAVTQLSMSLLAAPTSVQVGAEFVVSLRVTNGGATPSPEATAQLELPAEYEVVRAVAGGGVCRVGRAAPQCTVPRLAAGGHTDVMVTLRATSPTVAAATATLTPTIGLLAASSPITIATSATAASGTDGSPSTGGGNSGGTSGGSTGSTSGGSASTGGGGAGLELLLCLLAAQLGRRWPLAPRLGARA